jgi:hypothetical protein
MQPEIGKFLDKKTAQHSVHLTGGYAPRFQAFSLAPAGSVKMALSCPSRQQVTQAVGGRTGVTENLFINE